MVLDDLYRRNKNYTRIIEEEALKKIILMREEEHYSSWFMKGLIKSRFSRLTSKDPGLGVRKLVGCFWQYSNKPPL